MNTEAMILATDIVTSYVSNNQVQPTALPDLIRSVYDTLANICDAPDAAEPVAELKPAVPVKKSVTPEYIICLEDGKKMKMLKRHLMSRYGITPDEYRAKWGLPADYPMVAPNYAKERSELAKTLGLGKTPVLRAVA